MLPKQIDEVRENRMAIAPYNFVPLPEIIVPSEPLRPQDRYDEDRITGRIDCVLTTETPLYVRCGLTPEQFACGEQAKDQPDFFYTVARDVPVIPGSSLRGLLRTLIEIVGYGKVERVTKERLFYRSLADPSLRDIYASYFIEDCRSETDRRDRRPPIYRTKVRAGFLQRTSQGYTIQECDFGRIDQRPNQRGLASIPRIDGESFYIGDGPGRTPNWTYQHRTIYVQIDAREQDYFFPAQVNNQGRVRHPDLFLRFCGIRAASFNQLDIPASVPGTLVITGHMQFKHMEFVFLHKIINEYPIPDSMIERFHDPDQITKWQEDAFPKDRPQEGTRQDAGYLRDGEPIFFLLEDDQETVQFLGRVQMFRLPYYLSPYNFVPRELQAFIRPLPPSTSPHDLAEAIFGYVRSEKIADDQARAGRIFVGDAVWDHEHTIPEKRVAPWLNPEPITPRILGSPKPTTFQHYLVQQRSDRRELKHYASNGQTVIRGHKLYWHQGEVTRAEIEDQVFLQQPAPDRERDTQHTRFKPVDKGVAFRFAIHIENLSRVELGALLWVLDIAADNRYRLALGMGKPLGMGVVRIRHTVVCTNRVERYTTLFDSSGWAAGDRPQPPEEAAACRQAFETHVIRHSGEQVSQLKDALRIQCLLLLLSWPGPGRHMARYMEIERPENHPQGYVPAGRSRNGKVNEYAERAVLPTPHQVMGARRPEGPQRTASIATRPPTPGTRSTGTRNLPQPAAQSASAPAPPLDPQAREFEAFIREIESMHRSTVVNAMRSKVERLAKMEGLRALKKRAVDAIIAKAGEVMDRKKIEAASWYPMLRDIVGEDPPAGNG